MPTITASSAPKSNAQGQQGDGKTVVATLPFTRASVMRSTTGQTVTGTLSASTQVLQDLAVPVGGFVRYFEIQVTITSAGNSAAVAYQPDTFWNFFNQVSVVNASGDPILSPISGYQLYLINKYGLHTFLPQDPKLYDEFTQGLGFATGTGGTAGSGTFKLRIPFEVCARDALGCLPNSASNMTYNVKLIVNTLTSIYSTSPTVAPTFAVATSAYWWSAPPPVSPTGVPQEVAPMSVGATALWRVQTIPVSAGDIILKLSAVGATIRNMICTLRTTANARTAADMPAVMQFRVNGTSLLYKTVAQVNSDTASLFRFDRTATRDAAGGLDNAVFLPFPEMNGMRGYASPDAPRDQWLPTEAGTALEIQGTSWGATAGKLEVLTNELRPGQGGSAPIYAPVLN